MSVRISRRKFLSLLAGIGVVVVGAGVGSLKVLEHLRSQTRRWCEFLAVSRCVRHGENGKYGYLDRRVIEARGLFVCRLDEYEEALDAACDDILLSWLVNFVEVEFGWPRDTIRTGRGDSAKPNKVVKNTVELTNGGRILVENWRALTSSQEEENEYRSDQEIYDVDYGHVVSNPKAQRSTILKGLWWHKSKQALVAEPLEGNEGEGRPPHQAILKRLNETTPLGVDVDPQYGSGLKLLKTYYNLKYFYPNAEVHFYRTGKGWHFEAQGVRTNLDARRSLADCRGRLWFSEIHGGDDILFDHKQYPRRSKWNCRNEMTWRP